MDIEKFKSGIIGTYMVVSASVGVFASIIVILVDDIAALPLLATLLIGSFVTTVIAGIAYLPIFLKLRQITRRLYAVNKSKQSGKIDPLPFGILKSLITESNALIEKQTDFQSMRGRLYEQISEVAAQEERNRLARDLHDSIKQQVFSMSVSATAAHVHLDSNPQAAKDALADVRRSAQEAMVEMRVLLQQLAPAPLEKSGLIESMKHQMEALSYRTGASISTQFDKLPPNELLPIGAQETLFRIAQEALSNVARHARAHHVSLSLKHHTDANTVILKIIDDGQGFDMEAAQRGMGLNNMERRVEDLNAEIVIESAVGDGTTLTITIHLEQDDALKTQLAKHVEYKKQAETLYYKSLGVSGAITGTIFGGSLTARGILKDSNMWLIVIMSIVMIASAISLRYVWRNYRRKNASLHEQLPPNHAVRDLIKQQRNEAIWIIWLGVAFVVPGSFIGINNMLWLPTLLGVIVGVFMLISMSRILIFQHRYLSGLLPQEIGEALRSTRIALGFGVLSTVFVALTVILPGTSTGLYLIAENTDQWDSNFFTMMVVTFTLYHLSALGLYAYWHIKTRNQQITQTEQTQ